MYSGYRKHSRLLKSDSKPKNRCTQHESNPCHPGTTLKPLPRATPPQKIPRPKSPPARNPKGPRTVKTKDTKFWLPPTPNHAEPPGPPYEHNTVTKKSTLPDIELMNLNEHQFNTSATAPHPRKQNRNLPTFVNNGSRTPTSQTHRVIAPEKKARSPTPWDPMPKVTTATKPPDQSHTRQDTQNHTWMTRTRPSAE